MSNITNYTLRKRNLSQRKIYLILPMMMRLSMFLRKGWSIWGGSSIGLKMGCSRSMIYLKCLGNSSLDRLSSLFFFMGWKLLLDLDFLSCCRNFSQELQIWIKEITFKLLTLLLLLAVFFGSWGKLEDIMVFTKFLFLLLGYVQSWFFWFIQNCQKLPNTQQKLKN